MSKTNQHFTVYIPSVSKGIFEDIRIEKGISYSQQISNIISSLKEKSIIEIINRLEFLHKKELVDFNPFSIYRPAIEKNILFLEKINSILSYKKIKSSRSSIIFWIIYDHFNLDSKK